jgi:hypothetical protein
VRLIPFFSSSAWLLAANFQRRAYVSGTNQ